MGQMKNAWIEEQEWKDYPTPLQDRPLELVKLGPKQFVVRRPGVIKGLAYFYCGKAEAERRFMVFKVQRKLLGNKR
jgi:hypothetical protein